VLVQRGTLCLFASRCPRSPRCQTLLDSHPQCGIVARFHDPPSGVFAIVSNWQMCCRTGLLMQAAEAVNERLLLCKRC